MTTPTVTEIVRNGNQVGERVELARYTVTGAGERVLFGQRIQGVVRVSDCPASGQGRAVLVERELEQDGHAALLALVEDYVREAVAHDEVPMLRDLLTEPSMSAGALDAAKASGDTSPTRTAACDMSRSR
jgi:hypothetical protein